MHGIGEHEPASIVKRDYDFALFRKDLGDNTKLAYWADILHGGSINDLRTRGLGMRGLDQPVVEDVQSVPEIDQLPEDLAGWRTQRGARGNPQDQWDELRRQYEEATQEFALELQESIRESGGRTKGVSARFLQLRDVTGVFTRLFFQDVHAYWFDPEVRAEVQMRLRTRLSSTDRKYVLVTHSLGTVIAYDVLNQLADEGHHALEIPLWITLGSPLGVGAVQDFIYKDSRGRLRFPPQVRTWRNFYDKLDPISLNSGVEADFRPGTSLQGQAQTLIDSPSGFRNTRRFSDFNPHHSAGYLEAEPVREAVREVVGSDFIQRSVSFIVARDVHSNQTGDPYERHDVLLELHRVHTDQDPVRDEDRAGQLASEVEQTVREIAERRGHDVEAALNEATVDPLKRFVAAQLTSEELDRLCERRADLRFYRIWSNGRKSAYMNVSAERVQAYTARLGYNARGQKIGWAVLDTGIRTDHPHFNTEQSATGHNPDAPDSKLQVWDCTELGRAKRMEFDDDRNGHGTHVAGVIGGSEEWILPDRRGPYLTNDRRPQPRMPFVSMAPEVDLYGFKVLDENGNGRDAYIIKALDMIQEINDRAGRLVIHGVNLSLGGPFDPEVYGCGHSPLCNELRRLWRNGVLVCVAAGNEGSFTVETLEAGSQRLTLDLSIGDPANLEEAIAVGSVSKDAPTNYGISYFSSRGPTADGRNKPDVVAPGEKIMSCNSQFLPDDPSTWYRMDNGTSMACPHVSGVLAAFLSARTEYIGRPDQVKQILMQRATDLGRDRNFQGAGLPNLVQMLANT